MDLGGDSPLKFIQSIVERSRINNFIFSHMKLILIDQVGVFFNKYREQLGRESRYDELSFFFVFKLVELKNEFTLGLQKYSDQGISLLF